MKPNILARKEFLLLYLKYVIPLVLLFTVNVSHPQAQGAYFWSEPILLFEEGGTGEIRSVFVISDSFGNVHVFWTVINENQEEYDLIYYTRRDASGWTTPVDIIAAPVVYEVRAAIGQDGFIHLIWFGFGNSISYSRAPIQEAEIVKNWSQSVFITTSNQHPSIASSASGNFYLAYPGLEQSGVFVQILETDSINWSSPKTVSLTSGLNTGADWVQVAISGDGVIHVVWTEFYYPESWPPVGVFYSQSVDGGDNWSTPILLADDRFDQINIYISADNTIHVAWNGMAGVGGRYYRWSSDGGQTWSETTDAIPAGLGGTEGLPQIVVDQSGTLHMLTTYDACVWYTYFENQRWAPPVCISGEIGQASNYIEYPAMEISEGNKLHAVFWDDTKRLWYTTKVTHAPRIPPEIMENEYPQPTQSPVQTDSPVTTPTTSSTRLPIDQQLNASSKFNLNPAQLLIFSLSPAILLVLLIAALRIFKKTR